MTVTRDDMADGPPDRDAAVGSGGGRDTGASDGKRGGGGRGGGKGGERRMVPAAEFTSYYGHPIVKAPRWSWDIAAYLFCGGLAAGSSLLAAGGDLTGRPALRRAGRLGSLGALLGSTYFLIHDLGRPSRFYNMLRVAKPSSPMSMGTWILAVYGPAAGLAATTEAVPFLPAGLRGWWPVRLLGAFGRPAGLVAALTAPGLASYTAVLLADTAVPSWHEAHHELPFVFVSSGAAAGAGLAMVAVPLAQAGPARRQAVLGAVAELAVSRSMEHRMGMLAEPFSTGRPGTCMRASRALTAGGALLAATLGARSRTASVVAGAALMAGSVCTRFGIYYGGVASANDPRYTVVPQRQRVQERAGLAHRQLGQDPSTEPEGT